MAPKRHSKEAKEGNTPPKRKLTPPPKRLRVEGNEVADAPEGTFPLANDTALRPTMDVVPRYQPVVPAAAADQSMPAAGSSLLSRPVRNTAARRISRAVRSVGARGASGSGRRQYEPPIPARLSLVPDDPIIASPETTPGTPPPAETGVADMQESSARKRPAAADDGKEKEEVEKKEEEEEDIYGASPPTKTKALPRKPVALDANTSKPDDISKKPTQPASASNPNDIVRKSAASGASTSKPNDIFKKSTPYTLQAPPQLKTNTSPKKSSNLSFVTFPPKTPSPQPKPGTSVSATPSGQTGSPATPDESQLIREFLGVDIESPSASAESPGVVADPASNSTLVFKVPSETSSGSQSSQNSQNSQSDQEVPETPEEEIARLRGLLAASDQRIEDQAEQILAIEAIALDNGSRAAKYYESMQQLESDNSDVAVQYIARIDQLESESNEAAGQYLDRIGQLESENTRLRAERQRVQELESENARLRAQRQRVQDQVPVNAEPEEALIAIAEAARRAAEAYVSSNDDGEDDPRLRYLLEVVGQIRGVAEKATTSRPPDDDDDGSDSDESDSEDSSSPAGRGPPSSPRDSVAGDVAGNNSSGGGSDSSESDDESIGNDADHNTNNGDSNRSNMAQMEAEIVKLTQELSDSRSNEIDMQLENTALEAQIRDADERLAAAGTARENMINYVGGEFDEEEVINPLVRAVGEAILKLAGKMDTAEPGVLGALESDDIIDVADAEGVAPAFVAMAKRVSNDWAALWRPGYMGYLIQSVVWKHIENELFDQPFEHWGKPVVTFIRNLFVPHFDVEDETARPAYWQETVSLCHAMIAGLLHHKGVNENITKKIKKATTGSLSSMLLSLVSAKRGAPLDIKQDVEDIYDAAFALMKILVRCRTYHQFRRNCADSVFVQPGVPDADMDQKASRMHFDPDWMQKLADNATDEKGIDLVIAPCLMRFGGESGCVEPFSAQAIVLPACVTAHATDLNAPSDAFSTSTWEGLPSDCEDEEMLDGNITPKGGPEDVEMPIAAAEGAEEPENQEMQDHDSDSDSDPDL